MSNFDCPEDLIMGEEIELFETQLAPHPPIFVTVEANLGDSLWIRFKNGAVAMVSTATRWRRVVDLAKPVVKSGAWCTGKHCPQGYFEYAEPSPTFKCYSCRNR